jgi:hypothetical protein
VAPQTRRFFVADFNARGELRAQQEYRYEHLEQIPGAAELIVHCSTSLWRSPQEFEISLPLANTDMKLRWLASAETAGIATLRTGRELTSLSLLASGIDENADRATLEAFQLHLVRELHDTGIEPAFGITDLTLRPIVATIAFRSPADPKKQLVAALADRCFAAAYFRRLSLA